MTEQDDVTVKLDAKGSIIDERADADVTLRIIPETSDSSVITATSQLRNADEEIKLMISTGNCGWRSDAETQEFSEEFSLCRIEQLYSFGDKLGSGGQGVVYSGYDQGLQREVAIKSLHREFGEANSVRNDFVREARLMASLDHPAVIPIYNLCTDDKGGLNLAMKKLYGISLREYLQRTNERYDNGGIAAFDEETAMAKRLNMMIKVCEAIGYVHSKQIIHCDLKPENIMLGEFGEVYIVDWGIARYYGGEQPDEGKIMGTPRYTSPENLNGLKCDNRSDIYSLGVILFEAMTLSPAFSGESAAEVVSKVKRGEFNELRHRYNSRISRDLAAVIRKATAVDPEQRYADVTELTADLQAYRRGAEVSARPDSAIEKMLRWTNRNRRKAAAVAVGALMLLIAASAVLFFSVNMRMSETQHLKDSVADMSLASAMRSAVRLDRMMSHIGTMLGVLNSDLALLLDLNRAGGAMNNMEIVPGHLTQRHYRGVVSFTPEAGAESHFNPGEKLNLSRAAYVHPADLGQKQILHTLSCLRPVVARMRRTVLKSDQSRLKSSTGNLLAAYRKLELPVSFCYFTLQNGLSVVFPGNDSLPSDYDGRTRVWYKNAEKKGAVPVWSTPYSTAVSGNAGVISCSMEIVGAKEKVYGVSAADVPFKVLAEFLLDTPENSVYTIERMLISPDGRIIARSLGGRDGFKLDDSGNSSFNSKLLAEVISRRYGRIILQEDGGEVLWLYSYIPSAQWSYVEKIDMDKLMLFKQSSL